ncbi:GNAT family N-acetyltransferase [Primorskyibacter sp. 2E233]|uniref:GNAT family N-acetyltransferase n=1 Tax=Primorskyibacter sp. 2E233 TaxID=3413431 RepID=UPI003BF15A47
MIQTKRLILREAQTKDLYDLHAIFSDPSAMRYWSHAAHDDIDRTEKFLEWFINRDLDKRVDYILEFEGRCIGKAGMWKKPEVGYLLHPDHWGKGLAFEAMQAILPMCFAKFPDIPAVTAEADPRNIASIRLLGRLGFEQVELREKDFLYDGTEWCDTAVFALPRP